MRALIFAVMITLLLLRSWTGDVMASGTAGASRLHPARQRQPYAIKIIATQAYSTRASAHFFSKSSRQALPAALHGLQTAHHCAEHSASDASPASPFAKSAACGTCPACHGMALPAAAASLLLAFGPRMQPAALSTRFASADAAPSQKPPIS